MRCPTELSPPGHQASLLLGLRLRPSRSDADLAGVARSACDEKTRQQPSDTTMKETERASTLERINRSRIERLMSTHGAKGTTDIMTGVDPDAAIKFGIASHAVLQKMVRNG